ncbi:hypothetical protein AOLI_G00229250 [Acnodon oligacanthus]
MSEADSASEQLPALSEHRQRTIDGAFGQETAPNYLAGNLKLDLPPAFKGDGTESFTSWSHRFETHVNARPRKPGESLDVYSADITHLVLEAFPNYDLNAQEGEKFRRFVAGLDPTLQSKIHEMGASSMEEAVIISSHCERARTALQFNSACSPLPLTPDQYFSQEGACSRARSPSPSHHTHTLHGISTHLINVMLAILNPYYERHPVSPVYSRQCGLSRDERDSQHHSPERQPYQYFRHSSYSEDDSERRHSSSPIPRERNGSPNYRHNVHFQSPGKNVRFCSTQEGNSY